MKLKKENVYVKVTTLEESQELLKVLTESGEILWGGTEKGLKEWSKNSQRNPCVHFEVNDWSGAKYIEVSHKTQVTIQQLKEILKPMTLEKALAELESLKGKIEGLIEQQAESDKKEIQFNRWYKSNVGTITFVTDNKTYYGFDWAGNWSNDVIEKKSFKTHFDLGKWDLMNNSEVEQALIKEARKRYNIGCEFKRTNEMLELSKTPNAIRIEKISKSCLYKMYYCSERNGLYTSQGCVIFIQGEWAEVIDTERTKLDADIEALKEKYKYFKITVIVE